MATPKQSAQQLLAQLPDQATWGDIMYVLYVRQKIEAGLKAAAEGRTVPHDAPTGSVSGSRRRPAAGES
jgi:predicted transcriptional regulator